MILKKIRSRFAPLVMAPSQENAVISDLFLWRSDEYWKTFFDFMDLPGLFDPNKKSKKADLSLVIFDQLGERISDQIVTINSFKRNIIDVSNFIDSKYGAVGTFAVFHQTTPESVRLAGSFISDRGYVSYKYKSSKIRGYMHGNLDAIAQLNGDSCELLVGRCFMKRRYNIQYLFEKGSVYEVILMNPTRQRQTIKLDQLSASSSTLINYTSYTLHSGEVRIVRIYCEENQRLVLISKIAMARPMVYRLEKSHCEVFHG